MWGPGKASNDSVEGAGNCEQVESDNKCIESCIEEKIAGPRPRYTVLPDMFSLFRTGTFKNCQDWSNDTLDDC